jgi:hypothetical protein
MSNPKIWSSGCGRIELPFFKKEYSTVPLIGHADDAVLALMKQPEIIKRFDKYDDDTIFKVVRPIFGDYEDDEIQDREDNIRRIIWIACCELQEGRY